MDEKYMREALKEAKLAYELLEVPIGAVIVKDGKIIGRGHNYTIHGNNPTLHAEMMAIEDACKTISNYRLCGCDMYVTCEPCYMCSGALVLARIDNLYIGTLDPKAGACVSLNNVGSDKRLNHNIKVHVGLLQDECREILEQFFRELRRKKQLIKGEKS